MDECTAEPCAFWIEAELLDQLLEFLRAGDETSFRNLFAGAQPVGGGAENFTCFLGDLLTVCAIHDVPERPVEGHIALKQTPTERGLAGMITIRTREQAKSYADHLLRAGLLEAGRLALEDGMSLYHGEVERVRTGLEYLSRALDVPAQYAAVALWMR
jgi:hypothetical protein